MAKRVKIPGRLESAETGNIVTGADAVMDDEKGKTQVVINSEVDAAIINLAQGKQDNLTFDSAPTEDSPNPVTSAGVYTADKVLSDAIEAILLLIPSAASALNKLVDMQTMNSSIATATASFKGTYNLVSDLHLGVDATHEQIGAALDALSLDADNNDYAFVQVPNSATAPTEISKTERYKFNGENWLYEYDLNNSGFTSPQWNAINSGVTSLLVDKLSHLPTNAELTTLLAGKQDNLTFDNVPTAGSPNPVKSGGVYARNNEIVALINALDVAKQDVLTFDNAPVEGSPNPVKSGGVYTAISAVQAAIVALDAAKQDVLTFDSTPTLGSPNPVTSSGIKTELNRIDGNITTLNDLYEALTQSALVIVQPTDTWPVASPATKTIYRVVDRVNTPPQYYSDYMWNGTTMVLMAQYDNAINDEPTAGSNNLVKSGGVWKNNPKKTILIATAPSLSNSSINATTGVIVTDAQYMNNGVVVSYAAPLRTIIFINLVSPYFDDGYAWCALYKNGVFVKCIGHCDSYNTPQSAAFYSDGTFDEIKICYAANHANDYNVFIYDWLDFGEKAEYESNKMLTSGSIYVSSMPKDELIPTSTIVNAGIVKEDGSIEQSTPQYMPGSVSSYTVNPYDIVGVVFTAPNYNDGYACLSLYRNNMFIKNIFLCNDQPTLREYIFINDLDIDTVKISYLPDCEYKVYSFNLKGGLPNVFKDSDVPVITKEYDKTHVIADVGQQFAMESFNWRAVSKIAITPNMKGILDIQNVMGMGQGENIVWIVDNTNTVIDTLISVAETNDLDHVSIDLSKYNNVISIYLERGVLTDQSWPAPVLSYKPYNVIDKISTLQRVDERKGILLLHFDATPVPNDNRIQLMEEFGLNCSWCLSQDCFTDNTFSAWLNADYESQYWNLIKRGDDFGIYPSNIATWKTEQGWKDWLDLVLQNLSNLGIYNVTSFLCGRLAINDDLYNAVKSRGFKIIRGGYDSDVIDINTYPYSEENSYMTTEPSNESFIVNHVFALGSEFNLSVIKKEIQYACLSKKAIGLMAHNVISSGNIDPWNVPEDRFRQLLTFIKSKVDSGELIVMPWRKYYSMVNKTDGHEWDYSRILKMTIN